MQIKEQTLIRIGKAVLRDWGILKPRPPGNIKTQRGSVWIQLPGEYNLWYAEKAMGPNWLEKCLDQAKIPKIRRKSNAKKR